MGREQQTVSLPTGGPAGDASARGLLRDRPRLLSYVGRWGRARRWLPADARLVLDVGCAFGYGTAALIGTGRSRRQVIGVERDPTHIQEAARRFPWVRVLEGDAAALPVGDGAVDAVVLLDVLEHVAEPSTALAEIHRVLRPGGVLVLSVPHRGLLTPVDPLNVYPRLQRRHPSWQPVEPADEVATGTHQHFTIAELRQLLGDSFVVERSALTGLGLTELVHLGLLVTFKGVLRWRAAYRALMLLHFVVYILDDLIPAGRWGYYLTIRATAVRRAEPR